MRCLFFGRFLDLSGFLCCLRLTFPADSSIGNACNLGFFFFLFFSESEISSMHNTQQVFPILQSFAGEEYCSSVNQKGVLLRVSS